MAPVAERLAEFLPISAEICASLDLHHTLTQTCEQAVAYFNVQHSALLLFSPDFSFGTVFAEFPENFGALGTKVPAAGIVHEEHLIEYQTPIAIYDVESAADLGPVKPILRQLGVCSILIVPIIHAGKVFGSFSLDVLNGLRVFTQTEIDIARNMAETVARLIATAEFFHRERLRAEKLDALRRSILAINTQDERPALLKTVVANAAELLNAQSAGLYEYNSYSEVLTIVAEHRETHVLRQIKLGQGMAGRLIVEDRRYMIQPDYNAWDGKAPTFANDPAPFGAVVAVLLKWQGSPRGVLFVDDLPQRRFSEEDAEQLCRYADQVVAALVESENRQRLELMLRVTNLVTEADDPKIGLEATASALLSAIRAVYCRVFLLDKTGEKLLLQAAVSRPGVVWVPENSQEIVVADWPGLREAMSSGRSRVIKRSHIEQANALDRISEMMRISPPINSLLLVPLRSKVGSIGLLSMAEQSLGAESLFTKLDVDLAQSVGAQLTIPVERLRYMEHYRSLLHTLDDISRRIRSESNLHAVYYQIVKFAIQLTGFETGWLYQSSSADQTLELVAGENVGDSQRRRFKWSDDLLSKAARTGESVIWRRSEEGRLGIPAHESSDLVVLEALPTLSQAQYVLALGGVKTLDEFILKNLHILRRFAATASVAIETARSFQIAHLNIALGNYVQTSADVHLILQATLTAITSEYGLQFNRAAILLLEESHLRGAAAVGQSTAAEAGVAWQALEASGLRDFDNYLAALNEGRAPLTELNSRCREIYLDIRADANLRRAIASPVTSILSPNDVPGPLKTMLLTETATAFAPMIAYGKMIGLIVADNQFTHAPITTALQEALLTFGKTAAVALENLRIKISLHNNAGLLRSLYEASNIIVTGDPEVDLKKLVLQACDAVGAMDVRLTLMNDAERPQRMVSAVWQTDLELEKIVRPDGVSVTAFREKKIIVIEDIAKDRSSLNPHTFGSLHGSAVCYPLVLREKSLGVMWFLFGEPQKLEEGRLEALQFYVNQAAIICDTTLHLHQMEMIQKAVANILDSPELKSAMSKIVDTAKNLFGADCATLWLYDPKRSRFLPQHVAAAGIHLNHLYSKQGKLSYRLIQQGYIEEPDLSANAPADTAFLYTQGIRSFRGVVLTIANEPVGVIYIGYRKPQRLGEDDRKLCETFARYAALVVSKARMLDHLDQEINAADLLRATSDSVEKTLQTIADNTRQVLKCDAVVLYACNPETRIVPYLPALSGVKNKAKVLSLQKIGQVHRVPDDSIVYTILKGSVPYIAENAESDKHFKNRRFRIEEGIKSCMAIPVMASGDKLGVMFINYRTQHRFTYEERTLVDRFVSHLGVVIRNSQFRQELNKQQAIRALSQVLLSTPIEVGMRMAVRVAKQNLNSDYALIVRTQIDGTLRVAAAADLPELEDHVVSGGSGSHAGYAIQQQEPITITNFKSSTLPFTFSSLAKEWGVTSGIAVPMIGFGNQEPIGALLIHTKVERGFGQADETFLQLIADLTASAIRNSDEYEHLENFIRTASHELRDPLAPAALHLENLAAGSHGTLNEVQKEVLLSVLESVHEEAHLVDNMLNLVQIQDGRMPVFSKEGDLLPVIRTIYQNFLIKAQEKGLEIRLQLDPEQPLKAVFDVNMTKSVLRNLISNAIKFTDAGIVTIAAMADNERIWIRVCDEGIGISEQDQGKILDRFVRLTSRAGLGVGLSIAKSFVRSQGGEVLVESSPGIGSTFSFSLPKA